MNQDKLVVNMNGENVSCDILFSLVCNETHKGYIAYTDHQKDENNQENLFIGVYDPVVGPSALGEVSSQQEWDLINSIIEKIKSL